MSHARVVNNEFIELNDLFIQEVPHKNILYVMI